MSNTDPHAGNRRLYALDVAAVGPQEAERRWQWRSIPKCPAWQSTFGADGPAWVQSLEYRRDPNAPPLPSMDWHSAPKSANYRLHDGRATKCFFETKVDVLKCDYLEPCPNSQWFALTAPDKEADKEADMSEKILTGPEALHAIADEGMQANRFEIKDPSTGWREVSLTALLHSAVRDYPIRRKPSAHTVTLESGERVEVPKPMREVPDPGTDYWLLFEDDTYPTTWRGDDADQHWLPQGRCYATREARDQAERALTRILTGGAS